MNKILFITIFCLSIVSAQSDVPHTVEIITARGDGVFPVSFFNSESDGTYTAVLKKSSSNIRLETNSIYISKEEYGSFNLIVEDTESNKGIHFDTLVISKGSEIFQEIPIILGVESKSSEIQYDVSIEFNYNSDVSYVSGETVLSPLVNVYKLDYNSPAPNGLVLTYLIYSIDGEILSYSEEVVSVSRQASFEHFFNLGNVNHEEVLIVVSAKRENSIGLDLYQVSFSGDLLLSPEEYDYSSMIYLSLLVFLISAIILISYSWHSKLLNQDKTWKSELNYVKKTQFSDAAKGLRRLENQKSLLQKAYSSKYISKSSFDEAIGKIDKLSEQLKKRL